MIKSDFAAILEVLTRHEVEFIVAGGVGAVLQGAPLTTFDLDIVHHASAENVLRLQRALDELEAVDRAQPERQLKPNRTHLEGPGHNLLLTRFGPLDLLGSIGASRRYEDLLPHAIELKLGGSKLRVLELATLIAIKEEVAGDKDAAALPILRRLLEERRRR